VTHLGQRLSALIDGELDGSERERVLRHMAGCYSCRDEVAALRMLKRRTSALGQAGSGAGAGLTGRLLGLSALASLQGWDEDADLPSPGLLPDRPAGNSPVRGTASPEQRAARYFLAGSLAIFLAGLGTAAVLAGGESQPQAPTPPVKPSIDVMVFSPSRGGPAADRPDAGPASLRSGLGPVSAHPAPTGS